MNHFLTLNCINQFSVASLISFLMAAASFAQQAPFDVYPQATPPYYRVRYEASEKLGELPFPVSYTIWIPEGSKLLRGVIVHQHGCGEGSCKSGLTGAFDLHWQALARKHHCALLSPVYEQPDKAECQLWCDPRNGSDITFQQGLVDLGKISGHPELATVPWALWGHSGGGHWAGGMLLLHPERVAAVWLRSGVPLFEANPDRPGIVAHDLPDAALQVPIMCNLGTKEGVSVTDGKFASVWPANQHFFTSIRSRGGLIGIAIDPITAHECGNQRYLAIPWFDCCLQERLGKENDENLKTMPTESAWLAALGPNCEPLQQAKPIANFDHDPLNAIWLPDKAIANLWMQYVSQKNVTDDTPPPAVSRFKCAGNQLSWDAEADLESGLAGFVIQRDGIDLVHLPEHGKNPFGRTLFQNLQYSDTPTQPLVLMKYVDSTAEPNGQHTYQIAAVNTVGLQSPFVDATRAD